MRLTIPQHRVTLSGNSTSAGAGFALVSSGTMTLAGGNNVTLFQDGNAVTLSAASQTAQTQGILNAGVSTGGNTSGDTTVNSGTRLVFVGSNNITLSQGTAVNATTITISGPAAGGVFSGGMSTMGNTSGDTGYASQRLNLAGGNNITLSGSTNAGSMTITISAPNLGAGAFSGGASNLGNTAGSTGITGTRLVLVGTNNISLSQATDANGGTLSINNTASNYSAGISTMGNTAGSTGVTGTRLVLVGSHDLTLSQATDANGGTISFIPGPKIGIFNNLIAGGDSGAEPRRSYAPAAAILNVFPLVGAPFAGPFPGLLTCNTFYFRISLSGSTATMSQAFTSSFSFGIYTSTDSTLSLLNSCSTAISFGAAATNNSTAFAGNRYLTIGTGQWSSLPVFYPGSVYYLASNYRTSGVSNQSFTIFGNAVWASASVSHSGTIGVATVNANTLGIAPWFGQSSPHTDPPPASIASNALSKQGGFSQIPWIIMNEDNVQSF